MWTKIKNFISNNASALLPTNLVFGAIVGVIAGPGILGFLSELATYKYASAEGIRPPLEGIPYLRATVAYGSFFLVITCALVFWLSLRIAKNIVSSILLQFEKFDFLGIDADLSKTVIHRLRSIKFRYIAIFSLVVATILYFISLVIRRYAPSEDPAFATYAFAAYGGLAVILVWRPKLAWGFAATATLFAFSAATYIMFKTEHYSQFLRFVGYGGGIPVSIELLEPINDSKTISGALVLRTTRSLIIFDSAKDEIQEIPLDRVQMIKHPSAPLLSLDTELPSDKLKTQVEKRPPSHADVIAEIEMTIEALEAMERANLAPSAEIEERLKGIKVTVDASTMQKNEAQLLSIGLDFLIRPASYRRKHEENGDASAAAFSREQLQKLHARFK